MYVGLDNIISEGEFFGSYLYLVHKQKFGLLFGKFSRFNFHKVLPILENLQENSWDKRSRWPEEPVPKMGGVGQALLPVFVPASSCLCGRTWLQQDLHLCSSTTNTSILYQRQNIHQSITGCCHCQSLQQSLTDGPREERLHLLHLQVALAQAMDRSVLAAATVLHVSEETLTQILQINCSSTGVCCCRPMCTIDPRCQLPYESADL